MSTELDSNEVAGGGSELNDELERPMLYGKAPRFHEWKEIGDGLWKCYWCGGRYASKQCPDKDAMAF